MIQIKSFNPSELMARLRQRTAVSLHDSFKMILVFASYSSPSPVVPVGKLTKTIRAKHEDVLTSVSVLT